MEKADVLEKYKTKSEPGLIYDTGEIKDPSAFQTVQNINKHRKNVKDKIEFFIKKLQDRANNHDISKLKQPEIEWLIQMDKESSFPYGSPQYYEKMKKWEKFFEHHYKENRHHPNHFADGIQGFNIVDLVEFIADITSYLENMHPGDAIRIIDEQKERFGFDDQIAQILKNTLFEYFSWVGSYEPEFKQPE